MDTSWWYVIILAVVQGIAEFLPISSSGHLAVLGEIFGITEERSLALGIVLHAGSLLAILAFYCKLLLGFLKPDQGRLALMVIIGTIPAGIIGIALKKSGLDEKLFGDTLIIGIGFLITATLLRMSEKPGLIRRGVVEPGTPPTELKAISLRQTIIIGVTQGIAIIPGISRSGSTITAGILSGVNRESAGTFSFLLAIPAIGGAAFLELLSMIKKGVPVEEGGIGIPQMVLGLALSAAVSYGALTLLTRLIKRGKLSYFSWYLYILGVVVILWQIAKMARGH